MIAAQNAYRQLVRKVIAPVVGLVAMLLVGLLGALWAVADYQTATARQAQVRLVDGAVQVRGQYMRKMALDYGTWDEAYEKLVEAPDGDWADANIGVWSYRNLGFDMAFVVAPDGTATYGTARGRRDARPVSAILSQGIDTLFRQARTAGPEGTAFGLVLAEGRPAIATVVPIRRVEPRPSETGPRHLLVLVNTLDPPLLAELGRIYLLPNLRLEPPASSERSAVPVTSADGLRIGTLAWDGERPGDALLSVAIPVWVAVAAAFALLIWLGARQVRAAGKLVQTSELRSRHDPLTGLPNRVLLFERLDAAARSLGRRTPGFAVAYLDLDGFKRVNDDHGHDAGDAVLRAVAGRMGEIVGPHDVAARLGGDEFALLIMDGYDRASLVRLASALIAAIERPVRLGEGVELVVGATIGIAIAPEDGGDPLTLLRHADQALYAGKRAGRRRAVFHGTAIDARPDERRRRAVRRCGGKGGGAFPAAGPIRRTLPLAVSGARRRPAAGAGDGPPARRRP